MARRYLPPCAGRNRSVSAPHSLSARIRSCYEDLSPTDRRLADLMLEYPGDIVVKMYVSDPGRTTFESWATMARADAPDVVCAAGGATTIWVDFPKQKALALPDWLRTLVSD